MKKLDDYYVHAGDPQRKAWPNEKFQVADIQNLKACSFGDIEIWCPNNPEQMLKSFYGEDVMMEAVYGGAHYVSGGGFVKIRWNLRPWEFAPAKSGKLVDRVEK